MLRCLSPSRDWKTQQSAVGGYRLLVWGRGNNLLLVRWSFNTINTSQRRIWIQISHCKCIAEGMDHASATRNLTWLWLERNKPTIRVREFACRQCNSSSSRRCRSGSGHVSCNKSKCIKPCWHWMWQHHELSPLLNLIGPSETMTHEQRHERQPSGRHDNFCIGEASSLLAVRASEPCS